MKCLKESAVIMIFDDSFIQSEVSIFIRELISMEDLHPFWFTIESLVRVSGILSTCLSDTDTVCEEVRGILVKLFLCFSLDILF